VEPNGNEICIEIGSVLLSGSKGLMMFQSIQSDFTSQSDWNGNVQSLLLSYVGDCRAAWRRRLTGLSLGCWCRRLLVSTHFGLLVVGVVLSSVRCVS
jgi:hypothetical protein